MALFGLLPQGASQVAMDTAGQMFNPATQQQNQPAMQPSAFEPSPIGLPGLLGIKGGFRDALGMIGDAMLRAGGNEAIYEPTKRKQQLDHAMGGFADNPMEAIKRVTAIDPALGREMLMEQIEADQKAQKARLDGTNTQFDIRKKALDVLGGLVGAVTPETFPSIQRRLLEVDKDGELGLADVIRQAKTPEDLQRIAQAAITADQRADNERDQWYREERLGDFDAAEARQERNTNSQISSRATRDAIQERRATAYESGVSSQNANRGRTRSGGTSRGSGGYKEGDIAGTLPASRVPASARIGKDKNGRRTALVGGKLYLVQ